MYAVGQEFTPNKKNQDHPWRRIRIVKVDAGAETVDVTVLENSRSDVRSVSTMKFKYLKETFDAVG